MIAGLQFGDEGDFEELVGRFKAHVASNAAHYPAAFPEGGGDLDLAASAQPKNG